MGLWRHALVRGGTLSAAVCRFLQPRPQLNGFKLRTLFVNPDNATSNFYYGVNFEFSYNSRHWDEKRYTGEIRPILGYRGEGWSLTVNPILDNSYVGVSRLDFAPATRLDFEVAKDWTIAAEEYDDFGELRGFMPPRPVTSVVCRG